MDIEKLFQDAAKLETDFLAVIDDCKAIAEDLTASGIDAQAFFAAHAKGEGQLCAAPAELVGRDWSKLVSFLTTYGPIVYNILATMFGWPPIPTTDGD